MHGGESVPPHLCWDGTRPHPGHPLARVAHPPARDVAQHVRTPFIELEPAKADLLHRVMARLRVTVADLSCHRCNHRGHLRKGRDKSSRPDTVSYTHLRAHET